MVAYAEHHRLVMSGSIAGSQENFSFGLRLKHRQTAGDDDWLDGDVQDYLEATALPAVTKFWRGCRIQSRAVLNRIELFQVDRDGTLNNSHTPGVVRPTLPGQISPGSAGEYPWQMAIAVSLLASTVHTRQARRGRFYLPLPCYAVTGDTNRVADTDQLAALLTSTKTLIQELNAGGQGGVPGDSVRVVLAGYGVRKGLPDTPGDINDVDTVQVGDVLDTIRQRRNGVAERYQSMTVA